METDTINQSNLPQKTFTGVLATEILQYIFLYTLTIHVSEI